MTWGGWFTMILSISVVSVLLVWCIYKILTTPGESEKIHGFEPNEPEKATLEEDGKSDPNSDSGKSL